MQGHQREAVTGPPVACALVCVCARQGLQGSHLNLSQASAQRRTRYFLLNNKAVYGTASGSARGFVQHHSQQLSRAAVCGDAQNINNAARNMRVAHSFMTGLNAPPPCARAF